MGFNIHNLRPGEEVIIILRPHWTRIVRNVCIGFVLLALPLPFLQLLLAHSWSAAGIALAWAVGLFLLFSAWYRWYFFTYVLTNQRIIAMNQESVFSQRVSEVAYEHIQEAEYAIRGIVATIFRYGDVRLTITGKEGVSVMTRLRYPDRIRDVIMEIKRTTKSPDAATAAMIDALRQLLAR